MPRDVIAHIAYDGTALADGSMDVRDLAPALLALGDLLQEANLEINGPEHQLAVSVESDFKSGSFGVSLGLLLLVGGVGLLTPIATAKQIAEYVGIVKGGVVNLLELLKVLKGEKPEKIQPAGDGHVALTIKGSNNSIVVPVTVIKLYDNKNVLDAFAQVVKPLESAGIDKFEARDRAGQPIGTVTDADLPSFVQKRLEPAIQAISIAATEPDTKIMYVEVIRAAFRPNLRWTVTDGARKISAIITDVKFWARIDSHEQAFTKGQFLRVRMRFTQAWTDQGLQGTHEIVEVLDAIDPPKQQGLPS